MVTVDWRASARGVADAAGWNGTRCDDLFQAAQMREPRCAQMY